MTEQHDFMRHEARKAAFHLVKTRARYYKRWPAALDTLHPGLSCASTETLLAVTASLIEREERSPRRWFGFGGDVSLINVKAARILARTRRAQERSPKRTSMSWKG